MKVLFMKILFLSLILFVSCQKNEGQSNQNSGGKFVNELEKKSLEKLSEVFEKADIKNVEVREKEIKVGEVKIKLSTSVEFDGDKQDSWIFAARYDTKLINKDETVVSIGSIGIGKDRNDAVETSIDEWIGLFGTALSEFLAKSEGIQLENYKVHSGLMGVRGEKPASGWIDGSPKMNKKILTVLLPIIKKSDKNLQSINLILTVNKNGEVSGECRINNEVSQDILNEMKKLDWEKSPSAYMFKQFYLIEKN